MASLTSPQTLDDIENMVQVTKQDIKKKCKHY